MDNIPSQYLAQYIAVILALSTVVVTLWITNNKLHKKYSESNNENLLRMTNALVSDAESRQHLADAINNLPERIVDKILLSMKNKKG